MASVENPHLSAYQELYSTNSRGSFGGGKGKSRYYLSDGPRAVCWACLGEHESTTCVQKRCYRCSQPGHESSQCRSQEYCGFCGSMGHTKPAQCFKQVYNMGLDPRSHSDIQCILCGQVGHVNCSNERSHVRRQVKRPRSHGDQHH